MKAIITIMGKDRVGILAEIGKFVSDVGCNVEDISQTVMQGNFVMIMMVSLDTSSYSFEQIKAIMTERFGNSDVVVRIQRTEIFEQMYHV